MLSLIIFTVCLVAGSAAALALLMPAPDGESAGHTEQPSALAVGASSTQ